MASDNPSNYFLSIPRSAPAIGSTGHSWTRSATGSGNHRAEIRSFFAMNGHKKHENAREEFSLCLLAFFVANCRLTKATR